MAKVGEDSVEFQLKDQLVAWWRVQVVARYCTGNSLWLE